MSADIGKDDQVIQHDAGPAGVVPEPGDSLEPTPPADASATSGSPERRELSFRTSGLSIQLEISGTADSRRLTGQLIPRQSAVVDIRHRAGVITVEADALGRFSAESIPSGTVSMRCRLSNPISTGWVAFLAQVSPAARQGRLVGERVQGRTTDHGQKWSVWPRLLLTSGVSQVFALFPEVFGHGLAVAWDGEGDPGGGGVVQ
jgi:hypothetical protein